MKDQHQVSCDHHTNHIGDVHRQCIAKVPIFNHLDSTEMKEIVKETHAATYRRGESIYRAGEPSEGLYIVHKGKVKIYRLSDTGKEQIIRILGPGDFTGELSLFNLSLQDAFADAMEAVELCVMGRDTFQSFLMKYPAISIKVLSEFSARLSQTEHQVANIALESTETRLAMYLASEVDARKSSTITLSMSRKDLASYLGTSPETISRRLAEFEDAGWIRQIGQREIEVVDLDALLLV